MTEQRKRSLTRWILSKNWMGRQAALARFRNRSVSQFFYSADNLDNDVWEMRSLANESQRDVKQTILDLAVALGKEL